MPTTAPTNRPSPADRLLDSATTLFDREGIRAVGIDRLIADADVARASLYQHFGSKDTLVVSYLRRADEKDRAGYERAVRGLDDRPLDRVRTVFRLAGAAARRRDYRGCLYLNALTEFPDQDSPVRAVVNAHRQWLLTELTTALTQAGAREPEQLATNLQMLYDGALVGSKANRSATPIEQAAALADQLIAAAG
ncbi:TetR/AcrR family transcriptional regulator [Pseudonocardia spinosispora]|uniref:TetR/AcrR family transcriptional regulator n=1 Tax=Pseudonocardia spinosispora TaxID=103441 RepID=UPI0004190CF9|nr:TetR/AcrR family transcriptional regulator [Pseudonocardia spinosispora]